MGLKILAGQEALSTIEQGLPGVTIEPNEAAIAVNIGDLYEVMRFLKESPDFAFDYLANLTAVDYPDYFEVVYNLTSIQKKQTLVVKTRCSKDNPEVPSVTPLWRGADFQEREVYDLMGIKFPGHPNLRRILLWEGFEGYPLRKEFPEPQKK